MTHWKDSDAGRDWGQEEKGMTEDKMAGWHHWLDGHEFGWTPEVGDGQGSLACCDSWGRKESDMIEWLNWTELTFYTIWIWVITRLRRLVTSWGVVTLDAIKKQCYLLWRINADAQYALNRKDKTQVGQAKFISKFFSSCHKIWILFHQIWYKNKFFL